MAGKLLNDKKYCEKLKQDILSEFEIDMKHRREKQLINKL